MPTVRSPRCDQDSSDDPMSDSPQSRTAQNIKDRPAQRARATKAHGGFLPGSCNGLFSVGFPTGARDDIPPLPTLRTSFPLPPTGRPIGHRKAPLLFHQLFKSTTVLSILQAARVLIFRHLAGLLRCFLHTARSGSLQLSENSKHSLFTQLKSLWKAHGFCGKGPHPLCLQGFCH
jgi:hypothetical protein